VVEDGVNGLLCKVRSAQSLAAAMERMLAMTADERKELGQAGRRKVEAEYDQRLVAKTYLEELSG
jgi:glycosyltransferase involved in cell wall biosynthesis